MLKRQWVEDIRGWQDFGYLQLKGVPMKRSKDTGVIDFDQHKLEKLIAKGILENRVPLRGKELKLLRSVVRLSLNRFAYRLGITYGAVFAWEKAEKRRLTPINEIAVRLLCAEELNLEVPSRYSELIGDTRHEAVEITVTNKKPNSKYIQTRESSRPSYRGHRKVLIKTE